MNWLTDLFTIASTKPYTGSTTTTRTGNNTKEKTTTTTKTGAVKAEAIKTNIPKTGGMFNGTTQPNNIEGVKLKKTGKTVQDTALKGSVNKDGKNMNTYNIWEDGKNYYVYVDNKEGGYYINLGPINKDGVDKNLKDLGIKSGLDFGTFDKAKALEDKQSTVYNYEQGKTTRYYSLNTDSVANIKSPSTSTTGTGGDTKNPYTPITVEDIKDVLDKSLNKLKQPELATPEEMAKYYGVDYNYDNILKEMNDYVNQLYDDTAAEVALQRDIYNKKTAANALNTIENYVESYANASNNNVDRAARAANLLSSDINTMYNDSVNNRAFNNMLNETEAARKMELAANPSQALQKYNELGTYLVQGGQKKLQSEVQKYISDVAYNGALMSGDLTVRNAINTANANTYNSLLNAGAYNGYDQNNSYYNMFNALYGDSKKAANATTNQYASSAGVKGNSYVN